MVQVACLVFLNLAGIDSSWHRCSCTDSYRDMEHQITQGNDQTCLLRDRMQKFWESCSSREEKNRDCVQRPTYFEFGGLTAKPFWEADEIAQQLHSACSVIDGEFTLLENNHTADLIRTNCPVGNWSVHYLMECGKWNKSVCELCPRTTAILKQLPCCVSSLGNIYFSEISSGTHITPHYGCTDVKLRVQLPLRGCAEGCTITVNGESRSYTDGSPLIFDDSFLHEVSNSNGCGAPPRVVLVIDIWHPELQPSSIQLLEQEFHPDRILNFKCVSDATTTTIVSENPPQQRIDLQSAAVPPPSLPPPQHQHLIKVLPIGNHAVGKTSFVLRFAEDTFNDTYHCTIGVDFKQCIKTVDNTVVKIQLWETAGPEKFRTITSSYYRGANGILLIFSRSDRDSFTDLERWVEEVRKFAKADVSMVLVGNKNDSVKNCESADLATYVSTDEAQALADRLAIPYLECSAKTGENVQEALVLLTSLALKNIAANPPPARQVTTKPAYRCIIM